ncbi:putative TrapT family, fused dctM-Q subunits, C4-dicarboxylate transport [Alloalcanivorax dieselolei B5]|uniref:Putative TrapT family, fused dctM-Q subunits, C4-dicarboxylate transport n=1 Tax=Alcanivorax dieselolei (strain DSM 16502 / CGMCC 1.3690 / MCCC 1A00001 / B-5) TaxID=930169 RepID=K0CEN8_ALCDB|nr:TRAP transporter fused permease subunit [Alloalcanivorax dieselolei]AFT70750.1 putative TrapT family, fused dctM-Q subunits, C4-dicarboxylate transport [Alloalcanivorax dieselolei B5]GGJ97491.1 C4-dicarboxylate ABC transporter [Alloalcanivorax dieselolei]
MNNTSTESESSAAQAEPTRLGEQYSWQSLLFVLLTIAGLGIGIVYIFGITWNGERLLEGQYYWLFIGLFVAAAFIALPARRGQTRIPFYDLIAAAAALGISVYFSNYAWDMVQSSWSHVPLGTVMWLLMLEVARRSGGLPFLLVVVGLGLYPLISDRLPGLLMGIPYSFDRMIEAHVFRAEGMMGITTKIVAEIILGFLVFAGVLIATGGGAFFIDLANASFGRYRGGPAKVSVVASAFFGSLSGSVFSNIAGTGSITIPTMKKVGYPAHYAGAIEACASTGGVLMPPVMGAIAFVMAITIGVDYATVMVAAILPSLLFYFGLLLQVDAYAARTGLKGMPRDQLPAVKEVLKRGWPFISVLVFLIWGLMYMRWEYYAPWYACVLMVALSFLQKDTRMTPRRLYQTIRQIGVLVTQTAAIILPIAFVVSALTITGVTGALTSGLVSMGGGNVFLILLFGILACFIMGMAGLAIVAYIFLAVTLAPAIINVGGLNTIAVHFFIVYYAMLSAITPPVGAAAFLAATIAGGRPMQTSFTAMRLGVVIYFVPLFFLFQPALVLQGDLTPLIYVLPSIIIGIMLISGGLEGYLLGAGRVRPWLRFPLIAAGFAFSFPGLMTTIIGGLASAALVALVWNDNRRLTQSA